MKFIKYNYPDFNISHHWESISEPIVSSHLEEYKKIPMSFTSTKILQPKIENRGISGIEFVEVEVNKFTKNYDDVYDLLTIVNDFNLDNWVLITIESSGELLGGVLVASNSKNVDMLRGRGDLAVLWDIRVHPSHRRNGLGKKLFELVVNWSKINDMKTLHIETQNNNIVANTFYHKMGCKLIRIDTEAYYPQQSDEVQLIWQLEI